MKNKLYRFLAVFGFLMASGLPESQAQTKLEPAVFLEKAVSGVQLIDVRTPEEYSSGFIGKAENINFYDGDFETKMKKLNPNKPVYVYCKSGGRSGEAASLLKKLGFKEVYDLKGGIMNWEKEKLPLTKPGKINKAGHGYISPTEYDSVTQSRKLVIVDFFASWCSPCIKMAPYLEVINSDYKDSSVFIYKIDTDLNKELVVRNNIDAIPILLFFKNGILVLRTEGFMPESQMREIITANLRG